MNNLTPRTPDLEPRIPLTEREGSVFDVEQKQGDAGLDRARSASKDSEGLESFEIDDQSVASQGTKESLPTLDQINQQPESGTPLPPEGQAEFLASLVHADTKEIFPDKANMGTAAEKLQDDVIKARGESVEQI